MLLIIFYYYEYYIIKNILSKKIKRIYYVL